MKALIITSVLPPAGRQGRVGVHHRLGLFIEALCGVAAELHIAHLVPAQVAAQHADPMALCAAASEAWGRRVGVTLIAQGQRAETFSNHYLAGIFDAASQSQTYRYAGADQAEAVGRLLDAEPDIVLVHMLRAMLPVRKSGRRPRRLLFDIDDIDHVIRWRAAFQRPLWPGRLAYALQAPALLLATRRAVMSADASFVCSDDDLARLAPAGIGGRIEVMPNAVELPAEIPALPDAPTLLYIGSLDFPPNMQAADRMALRIMPLIRRQVPDATLIIAGHGGAGMRSRAACPPGVVHAGFVPDLEALYAQTRVVCCPLEQGSGTRVKLLEAGARARPMVSTRIGAEGLAFSGEREIMLRDDDQGFANACVALLRDTGMAARMGEAARQVVERTYAAPGIVRRIEAVLTRVLRESR